MSYEEQILALQIPGANEAARAEAHERWNAVAKPIGSLGLLEIDIERIAACTGSADIDIAKLVQFHKDSGKIGTFTGVRMPCRFGAVRTDDAGQILSWEEKPVLNEYINCGFFVFKREFLDYLTEDESCDLEKEPLQRLAADGQLSMYPHPGSWQCMDTLRDSIQLNELWNAGKAFWTSAAQGQGKEA